MSSYPDQPDNPDEIPSSPFKRKLGLADYIFMSMNPHAGQLLNHITNLHNQEQDRIYKHKRDRQADELHQAQLKRMQAKDEEEASARDEARKDKNFATEQAVVKEGGSKIKSMEDLFKYDASNTVISRAPGEAYRVPTERTVATRKMADKDTEAKATLQRKIEEKKQMTPLDVKEKLDTQTALMPGDLKKIGAQAEINAKNRAPHIIQSTDDEGNTTITGVDANTGQPFTQTGIGKVGKSKTEKADAGGLSTKAEKTLNRTQAAIDEVKSPNAKDTRSDQERFDAAMNAVKLAVAAHPGELEGGVDKKSGWPYVKPKSGGKPAAGGRTMSAAEYQSAVSKHGQQVTDEWIAKKGITVQ